MQLPIGKNLYAHACMACSGISPQHEALTRFWNFRAGGPRIYREGGHRAFVDDDEDEWRQYPRQPWDADVDNSKTPLSSSSSSAV